MAHNGLRLEADDHDHSATGLQGGTVAASAISFTPNGSIAATNVQAAIQEVRDEAVAGGGAPADVDYLVGTASAQPDHPQAHAELGGRLGPLIS